ncbi:hypothetical protein [Thioalkalivibrio nitratireducens]|uniref:hypothetical protein n=1 Tax=Thioalkalivibrio nitratireducens TaxID=186931 RepID=UPI0012ECD33A|nr:hypothetical protein [Thioalkalivibrio nitratireducens]
MTGDAVTADIADPRKARTETKKDLIHFIFRDFRVLPRLDFHANCHAAGRAAPPMMKDNGRAVASG